MAIKDKNGIHGRIGEFVYQVQKGQQTKRLCLRDITTKCRTSNCHNVIR